MNVQRSSQPRHQMLQNPHYNFNSAPQRSEQPPPQPRQSSIQTLETVVNAGDYENAMQQATELAKRFSSAPAAPVGKLERIKVRVVDERDMGPTLNINVRPSYSVLDLKILMCMEHGMPPPHEQIWIINGRVRDEAELMGHIEPDLTQLSMCLYLKRSDHSMKLYERPNPFELWWSNLHGNDVSTAGGSLDLANGHAVRQRPRDTIRIAGVREPFRLTDNQTDLGVPYGIAARRPRF